MCTRFLLLTAIFWLVNSETLRAQNSSEIACPNSIYVIAEAEKCGSEVEFAVPFENTAAQDVQFNHSSGEWFETGTTSIYFKGMDEENNTHFCMFDITVIDQELPVIQEEPKEVLAFAKQNEVETEVFWELPTITDNCEVEGYISTHESGEVFSIGKTPVTYWFYDSSGNCLEFTFTVTVKADSPSLAVQK